MARNRRHALRMVQQDAYEDARSLDGMPLSGRTVGTQLGNVLASVALLARVLESLLPADENPEEIELMSVPDAAPSAGGTDG